MSSETAEEKRWNRVRLRQTLTAVAALWAVVAGLTIVGGVGQARRGLAAANWTVVEGEVREATTAQVEVRGRVPVWKAAVHVEYVYTVDGRAFTGERLRPVGGPVSPASEEGRRLLALSPGDRVSVYVNPRDPAEAVLTREVSWGGVVNGLWLLGLAVVIGLAARRVT